MNQLRFCTKLLMLAPTILISFTVHATAGRCLTSVKNELLNNRPVPIEIAADLGVPQAAVSALPPQGEGFMRELSVASNRKATKLRYNFETEVSGFRLQQTYDITSPEAYTESSFELDLTTELLRTDGTPVRDVVTRLGVKPDCSVKRLSKTVTVYKSLPGRFFEIIRTEEQLIKAPSTVSRVVTEAQLLNMSKVTAAKSVAAVRALEIFNGPSFDYVTDDDDLAVVKMVLRDAPPLRRFNPFSRKFEVLQGIEFKFETANLQTRMYESAGGRYQVSLMMVGDASSLSDSISRSAWLNLSLNPTLESKPVLSGFKDEDFKAAELRYEIAGRGRPPLFNATSYFSVEQSEPRDGEFKWHVQVRPMVPPTSVAWDTKAVGGEQKYLSDSRLIQLSEGEKLARSLRPRLAGLSRLQASKLIIREINKLITYDDHAASTNVVDARSVSDVLRTRKGVCQHFSVLFTSIARSLGIPTRMVAGYSLNVPAPVAHSWVEVKINDTTWWPLDAQYAVDRLVRRGYLPVGEDRSYEADVEDPVARLHQLSREASDWKPFDSANIRKLN